MYVGTGSVRSLRPRVIPEAHPNHLLYSPPFGKTSTWLSSFLLLHENSWLNVEERQAVGYREMSMVYPSLR